MTRGSPVSPVHVGRYEFVALPLFGVRRMAATIDPGVARSTFTVQQYHVYQRGDRARVAFDIDE